MDVLEGPGVLALVDDQPAGIATWSIDDGGGRAEIRALVVAPAFRRRGVARVLLEAAHDRLRSEGAAIAWLVTTNDNLAAFALYQKAGYRLTELRAGAIDEARRTLKPSIGEVGEHGIPIRDELELAKEL
jgi:ribosomal protein S18 acetylase RimI-like enzyme